MQKRRTFIFILGVFLLALGVSFAIKSRFGVSPISSLPYALSNIVDEISIGSLTIPITVGMWTASFSLLYYLVQLIMLRKNFPKTQHAQIILALFLGTFIDMTTFLISWLSDDIIIFRIFYMVFAFILISYAIVLLFESKISFSNAEGMAKLIAERIDVSFTKVKVSMDFIHVLAAVILTYVYNIQANVIGIGTILSIIIIGPMVTFMMKHFAHRIMEFISGKE